MLIIYSQNKQFCHKYSSNTGNNLSLGTFRYCVGKGGLSSQEGWEPSVLNVIFRKYQNKYPDLYCTLYTIHRVLLWFLHSDVPF